MSRPRVTIDDSEAVAHVPYQASDLIAIYPDLRPARVVRRVSATLQIITL